MDRKSQLDLPFNWIFILVAGVLILAFFTGFAVKYKGLQDEKHNIELLNTLDITFNKLQANYLPTKMDMTFPSEFSIGCKDDSINIMSKNKEYKTDSLIFSSGKIKDEVTVWYMPYKIPFRVTGFYYLIPKAEKIYLMPNARDREMKNIAGEVNLEMAKYIDNVAQIDYTEEGPNGGKVVYFSKTAPPVSKKNWVWVMPGTNSDDGQVTINGKKYSYIGLPMLYGLMFSDNPECIVKKIGESREKVIKNYLNKIKVVQRPGCNYTFMISHLNDFLDNPNSERSGIMEDLNRKIGGSGCVPLF